MAKGMGDKQGMGMGGTTTADETKCPMCGKGSIPCTKCGYGQMKGGM